MMLTTNLRSCHRLASLGCLSTQQCISSYLSRRCRVALIQGQGIYHRSLINHRSIQTTPSFVQQCGFIPTNPFLTCNPLTKCEGFRFYASKKKGRKSKRLEQREEDFSDDEDEDSKKDNDWSLDEEEEEAESGPKTWKDLTINASSLRVDAILSSGLAVSRKKVEDAFLDTKILLNGKKITKKSKMVNEGDVVDMILKEKRQLDGEEGDPKSMAVMRVKVLKIKDDLTAKDRVPMKLRRWKYVETPKI